MCVVRGCNDGERVWRVSAVYARWPVGTLPRGCVRCVLCVQWRVRVEECQDPLPTSMKAVAVTASAVVVEAVPEGVS